MSRVLATNYGINYQLNHITTNPYLEAMSQSGRMFPSAHELRAFYNDVENPNCSYKEENAF